MFYNEQDHDFQQERTGHSPLEVKTKFEQFLRTRVADRFNLGADGRQPLPAAAWCAPCSPVSTLQDLNNTHAVQNLTERSVSLPSCYILCWFLMGASICLLFINTFRSLWSGSLVCQRMFGRWTRRDALLPSRKQLRVDVQDITTFDADLSGLLQDNPSVYLPLVRLNCWLNSGGA